MKKIFLLSCLICFISYHSLAQSVKVLGVNHADTVQHDAPFYLNTFISLMMGMFRFKAVLIIYIFQ